VNISVGAELLPPSNFARQLLEESRDDGEHAPAGRRQVIFTAGAGPASGVSLAAQPPVRLHTLQDWIQGARTDGIPMLPKFFQHPLAHHRMLSGVVKDMDLPEAQQDLAVKRFSRRSL